ncbi:MAG: rhodanese-like domain-containing protein [Bacteroidia bacterium]|nr:rhodanese-like domain-containing protein [Bacteroidia bacterium]MCF8426519.1 rhodanese-like domain-containing protein [Bacteroidia bacterium]
MENLGKQMQAGEITIVDVRTPGEFMGGHVAGSINIPLNEVPHRVEEFKAMKKVILCCASGGRSMQATGYLRQIGINCENGGSWIDVNRATA